MCGGFTKNNLFLREHANIVALPVVLCEEPEAVLLGGAVLAATASAVWPSMKLSMSEMCRAGKTVHPDPETTQFHKHKYAVWKEMYNDQMKYRRLMAEIP